MFSCHKCHLETIFSFLAKANMSGPSVTSTRFLHHYSHTSVTASWLQRHRVVSGSSVASIRHSFLSPTCPDESTIAPVRPSPLLVLHTPICPVQRLFSASARSCIANANVSGSTLVQCPRPFLSCESRDIRSNVSPIRPSTPFLNSTDHSFAPAFRSA